jgi:hypothetical protein
LNGCRNPSLGLATKAMVYKVASQEEAWEWRKVWGNEPSHSQGSFHFGSFESQWIPEFSKNDCKGQNPMDWRVLYIIGKLLKQQCLKWACMTNLDTENTSYGQKKGRESNWQFDSRPLKVGNGPDLLVCKWGATYHWKDFDEATTLFQTSF